MLQDKETFYEEDYGKQSKHLKELEEEIACLEKNREELVGRIARSGYEDLQMQLEKEEELLGPVSYTHLPWPVSIQKK